MDAVSLQILVDLDTEGGQCNVVEGVVQPYWIQAPPTLQHEEARLWSLEAKCCQARKYHSDDNLFLYFNVLVYYGNRR